MTLRLDRTDMAACRKLLKGGSRTFHAASKVLPRKVADPAIALYAFCRLADDAVDLAAIVRRQWSGCVNDLIEPTAASQ